MNAKQELLEVIEDLQVKCATVTFIGKVILLPLNHTIVEYQSFLEVLDEEYDPQAYGGAIEGTIWLTDESWLEREQGRYLSKWQVWEIPPIPPDLWDGSFEVYS